MQELIASHDESVSVSEKAQISGVQYLKNFLGQNTAVLIDLKEHSQLWVAVEEELEIPLTVQFLIDEQGKKVAVLLDFEQHGEIWEDIYDGLIINCCSTEPTVSLAEINCRLGVAERNPTYIK
jgi:hypothetical protein